jgi:hypothetical protein
MISFLIPVGVEQAAKVGVLPRPTVGNRTYSNGISREMIIGVLRALTQLRPVETHRVDVLLFVLAAKFVHQYLGDNPWE